MSRDIASQIFREPRHCTADATKAWVEIERHDGRLPKRLPAMLIDLSRHGMQIRVAMMLQQGERINVRLKPLPTKKSATLSATVQWMRMSDGNTYAIGCRFDDEIDFEILGECFLNGLLDSDHAV